jgi:hypothetical protein
VATALCHFQKLGFYLGARQEYSFYLTKQAWDKILQQPKEKTKKQLTGQATAIANAAHLLWTSGES